MFGKSLNDFTLKELQAFENKKYDGTAISDIIVVPVNKKHESKYRCMKYILINSVNQHLCGVLGGCSDILSFGWHDGLRTYRIDCLYRSKCLRIMISPNIILNESSTKVLSTFQIGF